MRIREINIHSLNEFLNYINQVEGSASIVLYRGQQEDWPLFPRLLREVIEKNITKNFYSIENKIFTDFKMELNKFFPYSKDFSDIEVLAIAQHYGLSTRLLDWTSDFKVAMWFAFYNSPWLKENFIYAIKLENENIFDKEKDELFGDVFTKFVKPKLTDIRIIKQQSWFSHFGINIFSNGADSLPAFDEYINLDADENYEYQIIKFRFNSLAKKEGCVFLRNNSITKTYIEGGLQEIANDIRKRNELLFT